MAELRRRGLSADTDYAGRSAKGQLTQAERLRAAVTVFAGAEAATVRRKGATDEEVSYDDLVERLSR
jgi:histidyl-tRNA synthetase